MVRWILVHLPHLLPPIIAFAFLIRLGMWASDQPPQQYDDEQTELWRAEVARKRAARRRPVARRPALLGCLALAPIVTAAVTGLAIYTFNLRSDRPSAALIWAHTGVSLLAVVLITVKLATIGWRTIRARAAAVRRAHEGPTSAFMTGLTVPLVITGVALLLSPDGSSFTDYLHLILSVWWTILLQIHLARYLGRSMKSVRDRGDRPVLPDATLGSDGGTFSQEGRSPGRCRTGRRPRPRTARVRQERVSSVPRPTRAGR